MSKKNMAIESGNYYDSKGEVANILDVGGTPPEDHPMNRMAVRSGDFYASDGSIHNLDELSGGGSGGTDAYIEAKDRGYTGTKDEFYTELGQVRDKVDKIEGMGLSSNDFTDRDKEVLSAFVGSRVRVVGEPGGAVNLDTLKVRAINNYQPELILAIGTLEGTDFTMSSMSSLTAISITRNTGFEIDDTIQFFNYQDASQIKAARRDSRNGQWTTSITGPFVDEAPLDNEEYVRKNGNWTINSGGAPGGNQWEEPDAETLSTNKRVEFKSEEPIDPDDPDSIAAGYIQQRTDALVIQPDWGTEGVKITGRPLLLMDGATLGSPESYQIPWAYIYAMTMYNRIESLDIAPRTDENNEPMDADVGRQDAPYNRVYSREYFIADRHGAHPRVLSEVYQLKEIEFDPTNYAPSENTIPGHLRGIDTALGNSGGGGEKQWEEPDENTLSTQKTIETKEIINEDYIYTEGMNVQEQLAVGGDIMLSGTGLKEPISKIQNIDDRVGDIEETLPLKADLVNGKVPDAQLPASFGSIINTTLMYAEAGFDENHISWQPQNTWSPDEDVVLQSMPEGVLIESKTRDPKYITVNGTVSYLYQGQDDSFTDSGVLNLEIINGSYMQTIQQTFRGQDDHHTLSFSLPLQLNGITNEIIQFTKSFMPGREGTGMNVDGVFGAMTVSSITTKGAV